MQQHDVFIRSTCIRCREPLLSPCCTLFLHCVPCLRDPLFMIHDSQAPSTRKHACNTRPLAVPPPPHSTRGNTRPHSVPPQRHWTLDTVSDPPAAPSVRAPRRTRSRGGSDVGAPRGRRSRSQGVVAAGRYIQKSSQTRRACYTTVEGIHGIRTPPPPTTPHIHTHTHTCISHTLTLTHMHTHTTTSTQPPAEPL